VTRASFGLEFDEKKPHVIGRNWTAPL